MLAADCQLILDLSSPKDCSVNSDLNHEEFSVKYSSFKDVIHLVCSLGLHCQMGKMDIKPYAIIGHVLEGLLFYRHQTPFW